MANAAPEPTASGRHLVFAKSEKELLHTFQPKVGPQVEIGVGIGGCCGDIADGIRQLSLSSVLPIVGWFPKFLTHKPFRAIISDLMVGVTVAAVVVPQGMAYGMLASLPPVYGLYTAIFPPLVYTVMGSCMHLSVGPFALIAMLTAAGITGVVPHPEQDVEAAIAAAAVISLLSGLTLLALGVLRLGFIATFLSDSVLSGYTTAVSLIIPASQLKYAFQLNVTRGGFLHTIKQLIDGVVEGKTNYMAFLIFAASLIIILALQELNRSPRFPALKKCPIPAELTVVVLSTVMCGVLALHERNAVEILGDIPSGMPQIKMPEMGRFPLNEMISSVLIVSLMTYITAMSVSKTFARKFGYEVDNNQELIALGCANLLGSISSGFPAAASLSRTAIVGASGAATPLHNFWTTLVLVIILLFCGPLLYSLPLAALAAVVVAAFKSLLLNGLAEVRMSRRVSVSDFIVWNIAFWFTLATSVTAGIAIAVGANLLFLFWKSTRPSHAVLGRLAGTERLYRNRRLFQDAQVIPGLMLFRFDAPLHFANRDSFATQLMRNLLRHDAELSGQPFDERATFWGGMQKLGGALVHSTICSSRDEESNEAKTVQGVVLDFSPVAHIDISAVRALEKLRGELAERDTRVVLAHCKFDVHQKLLVMGLFNSFEPTGKFDVVCFRELHDAVLYAEGRLEVPIPEERTEEQEMPPLNSTGTALRLNRLLTGAMASGTTSTSTASWHPNEVHEAPGEDGCGSRGVQHQFSGEGQRRGFRARTTTDLFEEQGVAVGANEMGPMDAYGGEVATPAQGDAGFVATPGASATLQSL